MLRHLLLGAALVALLPLASHADTGFSVAGPHVGFSSGPSQVLFGGQFVLGEVAPSVDLVPGLDIGVGDHETLISLNGDFHYRFHVQGMTWQPYAGAGIGLNFVSIDNFGPGVDRSETLGGGHLILGAEVPTQAGNRFYAEMKLGLGDDPDFKLLAGWNFKLR